MTRPTRLIRQYPRPEAGGLNYEGHVGATVSAALDGRPPTHTSASDPTTGDDSADGHVIGCRWINTTSDEEFVAADVSVGAAVWQSTTSGGGSLDVTDGTTTVSPTTTIDFDPTFFDVTAPGGDVAEVTFIGSGGGVTVEDEGTPLSTTATTLDFVGAGVTASGTGATKTITIPGGGGSGTSPEWWDSPNAPGGTDDEEFDNNQVVGTLTRVSHGTPKGSWAEFADGIEWTQSASGGTELDVFAVPLTLSVGDYVTMVMQVNADWDNSKIGAFLGFSNGTTFGTSDAVGAFCTPSAPLITLLNQWTDMNSRASDGTVVQLSTTAFGHRLGVRVKYEAANTWGVYSRMPGSTWRTIQTNYSMTLSPTHAVFGVAMNNSPSFTATLPQRVRLECFRVND